MFSREAKMKVIAAIVSTCLIIGLQSAASATAGDHVYARRGQLVEAGGARLNLYCMGKGKPAVVFDSGWEDWAPVWAIVQPGVARWTRACSYDRAGAGFSDAGPMPRTSVRIADELDDALHSAGVEGPYILVGHAFGGDNVRTFAVRHLADTAGLVLVEADVGGDQHAGDSSVITGLRECRDAIAGGKPLPPLPQRPGQPARTCAQQFFRGLPEAMWSQELNAKLLEIAGAKVAMYDAFISEMEQMPADEAYLQEHKLALGSRPLRVLTTGNHGVHFFDPAHPGDAQQQARQDSVARAQAKCLEATTNGKQLFTDRSSEYIPFDQPDFVIDAIHDVYLQSR
jgi:pimeloyl-ACP methyl ester carboxylesterase